MDIAMKDLIIPIIMLILGGVNIAITVSKMNAEEIAKFNSITAQAIEFILFWFVIGVSIFQITSEALSPDPISRWVVFKISLYFFFMAVIILLKLVSIFVSRFWEVYEVSLFQLKQLDAQGETIKEHVDITNQLAKKVLKEYE